MSAAPPPPSATPAAVARCSHEALPSEGHSLLPGWLLKAVPGAVSPRAAITAMAGCPAPLGRPDLAAASAPSEGTLSGIVTDVERHVAARPPRADIPHAAAVIIAAYTKESPVYKLANAWGNTAGRAPHDMRFVAPFYRTLLEGLRSLPPRLRHDGPVYRAVKVEGVSSLVNAFDNCQERFKVGAEVNFFSFCSWTTALSCIDDITAGTGRLLVFQCRRLEAGFRIDELSMVPGEKEVLLPCPSFFTVVEPPQRVRDLCIVQLVYDATTSQRMDYLYPIAPPTGESVFPAALAATTTLVDVLRRFYCEIKYKEMQTVFLPGDIGFGELYGTVTAVHLADAAMMAAQGDAAAISSVRKYAADDIASKIFAAGALGTGVRTALLEGRAGIGKSTMARMVARQQGFPGGLTLLVDLPRLRDYVCDPAVTEFNSADKTEPQLWLRALIIAAVRGVKGDPLGSLRPLPSEIERQLLGAAMDPCGPAILWIFDGLDEVAACQHPVVVGILRYYVSSSRSSTGPGFPRPQDRVLVLSREDRGGKSDVVSFRTGAVSLIVNPWCADDVHRYVEHVHGAMRTTWTAATTQQGARFPYDVAEDFIRDVAQLQTAIGGLSLPVFCEAICAHVLYARTANDAVNARAPRNAAELYHRALQGRAEGRLSVFELNTAAITLGKLCFASISSPSSDGHLGENVDLSSVQVMPREAIVRWGIVTASGPAGRYRVLHKSLAEFFAAKYVVGHRGRLSDLSLVCGEGKRRRFRSELRLTLLFMALLAPDARLKRQIVTRVVHAVTEFVGSQECLVANEHGDTVDHSAIDVVVNLDAIAGTDIFGQLPRPRYDKLADWLATATRWDRARTKHVPDFYRQCLRVCGRHNAISTLRHIVELVPAATRWTADLQQCLVDAIEHNGDRDRCAVSVYLTETLRCLWTSTWP